MHRAGETISQRKESATQKIDARAAGGRLCAKSEKIACSVSSVERTKVSTRKGFITVAQKIQYECLLQFFLKLLVRQRLVLLSRSD